MHSTNGNPIGIGVAVFFRYWGIMILGYYDIMIFYTIYDLF